jgi:hypothetical protein
LSLYLSVTMAAASGLLVGTIVALLVAALATILD